MSRRYYDLITCWACGKWKMADPGHKVCRDCEKASGPLNQFTA